LSDTVCAELAENESDCVGVADPTVKVRDVEVEGLLTDACTDGVKLPSVTEEACEDESEMESLRQRAVALCENELVAMPVADGVRLLPEGVSDNGCVRETDGFVRDAVRGERVMLRLADKPPVKVLLALRVPTDLVSDELRSLNETSEVELAE
jgi:hypothetical protein